MKYRYTWAAWGFPGQEWHHKSGFQGPVRDEALAVSGCFEIGLGFRVEGLGFRIYLGFRVSGLGFRSLGVAGPSRLGINYGLQGVGENI